MLASLSEPPIAQTGLVYEPKYDGIRALIDLRPGRGSTPHVAIFSRNGREKQRQFPAITAALARLSRTLDRAVLIDGEIVAVDNKGTPLGFQSVQGRIHLTSDAEIAAAERAQPAVLIAFDLLRDGDEDLRELPLAARRLRLQQLVRWPRSARAVLRLSEIAADDGRVMLSRARREGWEGLIVKDGHSKYHSGKRAPAWRKLKLLLEQEFVIGGWTEPRLTRAHFGALLVGHYDAHGALVWAGSVGTGFDHAELDRVQRQLGARARTRSPFAGPVTTAERAHWVTPDLVAQVRFTEWTAEGLLRQPVYLGLREDKRARDVRRERPRSSNARAASAKRETVRRASPVKATPAGARTIGPATKPGRGRTRRAATRTHSASELAEVQAQLQALEAARKDGDLSLPNGDSLRVTNLAKVLWPSLGITKGELLRYYVEVSPLLLPVVNDRPLVMRRFPNGIDKLAFYQQRHPDAVPTGVRREVLPPDVEPITEEGPRDRLIGGSLATLLYMTQIAAISQDPWFSRVADPLHQDYAAIDLDPGPGVTFAQVLDVARWVKDVLDEYAVPAWPKTSGSRGLHIYIPLPSKTTYETGQLLCQMIATVVATQHPRAATVERMVKKRPRGTVYVDYLQNILGKTLATAYSARATDYAGVSTPVTWKEVAKGIDPRAFTVRTAPDRFRKVGDLWAPLRTSQPVNLRAILSRA